MNRILLIMSVVVLTCSAGFSAEKNLLLDSPVINNFHHQSVSYQQPTVSDKQSANVLMNLPKEGESIFALKSKGKAFFLSLLLPGLGERYAGYKKKSEIFFGTEIVLWLTYSGFLKYRDWRQEDYQAFAATHAGVRTQGKSETYYVTIANFDNIDEYNAAMLRQRNLPKYYTDTEKYFWSWDNKTNRNKFEDLRISADNADTRATFALGAILANHLISAIDAVWSVHKTNSAQQAGFEWDVQFGDGIINPTVLLSMSTPITF